MLYRAVGHILHVQPATEVGMLTRARPLRDRMEDIRAPKKAQPYRGRPRVPASPATEAAPPEGPPRRPGPLDMARRMGMWKRISHWWIFTPDERNAILGIS